MDCVKTTREINEEILRGYADNPVSPKSFAPQVKHLSVDLGRSNLLLLVLMVIFCFFLNVYVSWNSYVGKIFKIYVIIYIGRTHGYLFYSLGL